VPRVEEDRRGKGAKGDEERGKVGGRLVAHGKSDEDDAPDDDENEGRGEVKPPLAEPVRRVRGDKKDNGAAYVRRDREEVGLDGAVSESSD
jgi:hypothetical protein